jgi:predicted choloylglycine hydrolase
VDVRPAAIDLGLEAEADHVAGATEVDLAFWAVDAGADPAERLPEIFRSAWPAYRSWYLRDGEEDRPTYLACRRALATHMPELLDDYDRLVAAVGGGDLEARFLSHWCPPPLFAACSLTAYAAGPRVLLRTYDYPPVLCDRTVLRSSWQGADVLAMSDCVWGVLDGVNRHGLAVALAFGGRKVVGPGFGIGLILRYVLQTAASVDEALAILGRVPSQLAYNVALLDRTGRAAIARVSPDRPLEVAPGLVAGNRQGTTEWPEHAAFCGTEEREQVMAWALDSPDLTLPTLVDRFLRPPLHRPTGIHTWGTVYTAAYDVDSLAVDLLWPGTSWRLTMDDFHEGELVRRTWLAPPPTEHIAPHPIAHGRPLLIA